MKILVSRDTKTIEANIQIASNLKPALQGIYDEITTAGIGICNPSFFQLISRYYNAGLPQRESLLDDYVKSRLFAQMKMPDFGIPIEKENFKNIIKMPDLNGLKQKIKALYGIMDNRVNINMVLRDWFILENSVVGFAGNIKEIITEQHSVYLTNKAQKDKYELIKPLVEAANNLVKKDLDSGSMCRLFDPGLYWVTKDTANDYTVNLEAIKKL